GPQTTAAVKAYQEHYGENVTGEVTSSTLTEMANRSESILQDGDYDDRAVSLKEHLEVLGYGSFAGTTYYGPQTSAAVARFQASEEGLTETGNADRKTIERLKNMAEGPLNNSMYREDAIEVKNYLEQLGFGSFNGTDYYGPQTASAVKRYQEHYELEVTGSVSKEALAGMQERAESILSNGDRHESAIPVKSHLEILGYGSFSGTTYYGPQTTAAVKAFQESEDGIAATGMANERTQERLKALAEGPLRNGMYREDAVEVKDLLQELGFGLFSGTSYFGPQTEAAVQNFQNHYGYTIDGEVSEETLVHLNEEYVNTLSNGDRADLAVKVKEHLEILGYGSFSGTTYYGPRTTAAIKEFQSDNDLYVNGIANPTTVELLETLAEAEEDVSLGIVTASSALNMRTAPNTSGKVINQLPRDTVVEILSTEDNGWHRIRFDDEEGYVSGNFIEEYIEIEGMNTGQVVVNSRLNIRSEPRSGNSNTIIDSLSSGTDVEIIETIENVGSQTWHQIRYGNGQLGYANAGYIHLDTGEGVAGGPLAGKTVYLDAGHGGPDPGGTANGLLEKEIALDVSLRAEQALREAGANVVMARRSDFYLTPGQRAFQSNNSEADIFVSVHANIFNGEANGTETIWHSGHESSNSERLAHNLQDATVSALNTNYRRVFEHSRTITVVEQNEIPSALLELGFMDHAGDAEKLRSSKYRDKSAEAITNGVLNYFQ
ncbi:peptidoglycan-binding protein, partial [Salisediminibacterium halotolerans]